MGQRANYVLVDESGRQSLFYSHWAANTIDRDLFWGPDHAIAFVRAQEATTEWLDDVWCEGAALVDVPRRALLFFGGENIRFDVMRHRLTLALMERVWQGWTVRWAFEGLGDVVDALGLSRALVRSDGPEEESDPEELFGGRFFNSVISVRSGDGRLSLTTCDVDASDLGSFSPDIVERLAAGRDALTLSLRGDDSVSSGAHLDVAARRVHVWEAGYRDDAREQLARRWSGWELVHHGAEFESQLARTDGALTLTPAPQEEVASEVASFLLRSSEFDPADLLSRMQASRPGASIEVNPHFFAHHPHDLPEGERARILTWALAGLPRLPGFAAR
jgi:hypothetical protein